MYKSFAFRLIYVFTIPDAKHRNCVKVGETSLGEDVDNPFTLQPNCKELNRAAKARIDQYTKTIGLDDDVQLLYTELTATLSKGSITQFNDKQVHDILERSGIVKKKIGSATEWFQCGLAEVKEAIKAAKEHRQSINLLDVDMKQQPIIFRPEQMDAIRQTKARFATNNQFLWNAKMRFGKTLSALQVVKELEFDKTIIITHRPVVDEGWFEDFRKIFFDRANYCYGSKNNGESFETLMRLNRFKGTHFVYFASMQDLRGSDIVGGNFDKNNEVFSTSWDLLIVDEAHEGTKTALGQAVIREIFHDQTKMLQLSGTPFNLFEDYKEDEIYTWDYVMEQRAKQDWDKTHWAEPNPYACLPKLNIYTFDLSLELKKYQDDEHAFNFAEFFRVNEDGTFKHNSDVDAFLNLLASNSAKNYPYSKLEWRQNLRHSLWTVPSVAAAAALSTKLRNHPVLGQFKVVNVAGEGDTDADYESANALEMVREAIGPNPEETMTITLSRGRLTTGVTVPAWTAVFMLHGSFSTAAASYMQTIFRAQSPAVINGKVKEECFVFDFAPDRTLKVLAETAKVSAKAGKAKANDKKILGEFLNFCPVISFHGAQMAAINVDHMMQQLKRVYVDRVVRNGFEDVYLYNDRLMQLDHLELEKFARLRDIIGQTKAMKRTNEVDVNNQGFTNEEYEEIEAIQKKPKAARTVEELEKLKEVEEKKKQRHTAISILRGISIRMPMILYGATITNEKTEITLDNFTELVDDQSWEEFMPKGVTKELFKEFIPYYDEDVFAASGIRIRNLAREADEMDIEERIERITTIFTSFRNPDKETVLTPWRVVNMQLADTLGGWCFYDEDYKERLLTPRYVNQGDVTRDTLSETSRVLEINSKSGLYPLYVAYSIYRSIIDKEQMSYMITDAAITSRVAHHHQVWDKVLRDNLFVICKTPMAKSITYRTLAGFRDGVKVNAHAFEDLLNQVQNNKEKLIKNITRPNFWNYKTKLDMLKFNAVVGNPPYQIMDSGAGASAGNIFHLFINLASELKPQYVSLVTPSRWFSGGKNLDAFRDNMLTSKTMRKIYDYLDSADLFPSLGRNAIKGGVSYFLMEPMTDAKCTMFTMVGGKIQSQQDRYLNELDLDIIVRYNGAALTILDKILPQKRDKKHRYELLKEISFSKIVSARKPFGLPTNFVDFKSTGNVQIYANKQVAKINRSQLLSNQEWVEKWKVYIPEAIGVGDPETDWLKPIIGSPGTCCTETYLLIGPFDTEQEALSAYSYMQTKFFHFLLSLRKIGQHTTQDVYSFIPLVEFNQQWTDEKLCQHYGISDSEWNFINNMIRPNK